MKTLLGLREPMRGEIIPGDGLKHNEIGYLPQQTIVQKDFPASVREIVLSGFVIACLLAVSPTSLSPALVKPTTDGVVLAPSALVITVGSPPSSTATHEFVVPKSIPITFPIVFLCPVSLLIFQDPGTPFFYY